MKDKVALLRFLLILVAPILTACEGMPTVPSVAEAKPNKHIVVASMLGDRFHAAHIGVMVFGNLFYEAAVPTDWNINQLAEQTLVSELPNIGPHTVAILQRNSNDEKKFDVLRALAKQQGADVLIIVGSAKIENYPWHKPSFGFYERYSRRCVYTIFSTAAYSVQTGRQLDSQVAYPCTSGETEVEWKDSFDKYTAKELELIRHKIEKSVKTGVTNAVKWFQKEEAF